MKINFEKMLVVLLSVTLLTSSGSAMAAVNDNMLYDNTTISANDHSSKDNAIITIDGHDYNAQEFMDRVLEYTIESDAK